MGAQDVPIKGLDYIMKSGKYKGKTLGELLESNPDFILMMHRNGYLIMQMDIIEKAKLCQKKVRK